MSYNIDDVTVLVAGKPAPFMLARDIVRVAGELRAKNWLPEIDLFYETGYFAAAGEALATAGQDARIKLEKFWWQGEGSGSTFTYFIEEVLVLLHGSVDLLLVWEGGDSTTGLRVKDGAVAKMAVKFVLVEK